MSGTTTARQDGAILRLGGLESPPARIIHVEWFDRTVMGTWGNHVIAQWARVLLEVPGHPQLVSKDVIDTQQVHALRQWYDGRAARQRRDAQEGWSMRGETLNGQAAPVTADDCVAHLKEMYGQSLQRVESQRQTIDVLRSRLAERDAADAARRLRAGAGWLVALFACCSLAIYAAAHWLGRPVWLWSDLTIAVHAVVTGYLVGVAACGSPPEDDEGEGQP